MALRRFHFLNPMIDSQSHTLKGWPWHRLIKIGLATRPSMAKWQFQNSFLFFLGVWVKLGALSKSGKYAESDFGSDIFQRRALGMTCASYPLPSYGSTLTLLRSRGATMRWKLKGIKTKKLRRFWHVLVWMFGFWNVQTVFEVLVVPVRSGQCLVFRQLDLRFFVNLPAFRWRNWLG